MCSVSIRLCRFVYLSIILRGFAKLCFCRAIPLLSVKLRAAEGTRCTAVTIITHLCVLWLEFRYISVSCGRTWSVFSACTLLLQSVACLQELQCESYRPGQQLRASCLLWCVCSFWQQSVVSYDSAGKKPGTQRSTPIPITSCLPACWWLPGIIPRWRESSCNLWHSGTVAN